MSNYIPVDNSKKHTHLIMSNYSFAHPFLAAPPLCEKHLLFRPIHPNIPPIGSKKSSIIIAHV